MWLARHPFFFCWQTNIIGLTWQQMYLAKKPKLRRLTSGIQKSLTFFSSISTNLLCCCCCCCKGIVYVFAPKCQIVNIFCMALRERERQDETQFTTKIAGKTSLGPNYFALSNFHLHLHVSCLIMPKLTVLTP